MYYKKLIKIIMSLVVVMSLLSCFDTATRGTNDESISTGKVEFYLQGVNAINPNILCSNSNGENPTRVLLKFQQIGTSEEITKSLNLRAFGTSYVTDDLITLKESEYELTRFDVLSQEGFTIYSTPMAGSDVAISTSISTTLNHKFTISEGQTITVHMQVIEVEEDTNPADFGFTAFTFEVVDYNKFYITIFILDDDDHWRSTKAHLEMRDGDNQLIKEKTLQSDVNTIYISKFSNYYLGISKLGYSTQSLYISESELLSYNSDSTALEVNLLRDAELITKEQLVEKIATGQDVSNVNVSYISDMSYLMDSVATYLGKDVNKCSIVQNFNQDISSWDVSNVTNMSYMFHYAESFNRNISNWMTNKVQNMEHMFDYAESFDQNISNWLVPSVSSFACFDDNTSATWTSDKKPKFKLTKADLVRMIAKEKDVTLANVSAITDMSYLMDSVATYLGKDVNKCSIVQNFDQDISSWNVSSVTNMSYMFHQANSFNQDISGWNVSNVTNMSYMFYYAESFNQDISNWMTNKVQNMEHMFDYAESFDQNISNWLVPSVSSFACFDDNTSATWTSDKKPKFKLTKADLVRMIAKEKDVTLANVSAITDMSYLMDSVATYLGKDVNKCSIVQNFDQDISSWNVSSVTNMSYMFHQANSFNQDISGWNVSNVTNMSYMFYYAESFNQDISNWITSKVENMSHMFDGAEMFDQDISSWDVLDLPIGYFTDFSENSSIDWTDSEKPNFRISKEELVIKIAEGKDVTNVNVSGITDMSYLMVLVASYLGYEKGYECTAVKYFNQDIGSWDVSNVTNMSYMFKYARFFNQDISSWDVSKVTIMSKMFRSASSFNQPLNSWNVGNVTDMSAMFYFAGSFNQPLNSWNVGKVTDMSAMFYYADSFNQPLNSWNVGKVTDMSAMFYFASSFNQPLNSWNVENVTNMSEMFRSATSFNQPLNSWNVENVTNMKSMFIFTDLFNQPLDSWVVSNVTDMFWMFYKSLRFDQNISGWDVASVISHNDFDTGTSSSWTSDEKPNFP